MVYDNDFTLSRQQVRAVDEAAISQLGVSGLVLMENAARGIGDVLQSEFGFAATNDSPHQAAPEADHARSNAASSRAVIVCGPGNNGGDGLALARQCFATGIPAKVILFTGGKKLSTDSAANLDILERCGVEIAKPASADAVAELWNATADDVIVDCLLGTGVRGKPLEPFRAVIDLVNKSPAKVLAVDVPSGLDCDSGFAAGACVQADQTVTFVAMKRGFNSPGAVKFTGRISVAHIGIPLQWLSHWLKKKKSD